ncbi:lytic polysaccharide monooxygenase [Streptomyces sp. NPDC054995]
MAGGYITFPPSRTCLAQRGENANAGDAASEPQGVEGPGGFPKEGPEDGKIASGDNDRFGALDEQGTTRWTKTDIPKEMAAGLPITWTITSPMRTRSFEYFITKNSWNSDKPLDREAFELEPLAVFDGENNSSPFQVDHHVEVPSDRSGYHVILGVWNFSDLSHAIYQVIDVNITS